MNLTAYTNERFVLPIDLSPWAGAYPALASARFLVQIRTSAADPTLCYAWDSAGAPAQFPGSAQYQAGSPPQLSVYAPSSAIARVFHPAGGAFEWDFGALLAASPTDFIRLDGGTATFIPGVSRNG